MPMPPACFRPVSCRERLSRWTGAVPLAPQRGLSHAATFVQTASRKQSSACYIQSSRLSRRRNASLEGTMLLRRYEAGEFYAVWQEIRSIPNLEGHLRDEGIARLPAAPEVSSVPEASRPRLTRAPESLARVGDDLSPRSGRSRVDGLRRRSIGRSSDADTRFGLTAGQTTFQREIAEIFLPSGRQRGRTRYRRTVRQTAGASHRIGGLLRERGARLVALPSRVGSRRFQPFFKVEHVSLNDHISLPCKREAVFRQQLANLAPADNRPWP